MKKQIILILFLVIHITSSKAQIKPLLEVEGGYNKLNTTIGSTVQNFLGNTTVFANSDIYKSPIYTNILIGAYYKKITVKQYIGNYFSYPGNGISFSPKQITYITGIYYNIKSFEIGYEHMCSHPIINSVINLPTSMLRSSYDKLYLKIIILK